MWTTVVAPSMPKAQQLPAGCAHRVLLSAVPADLKEGDARLEHLGGAFHPTGVAAARQLQHLLWGSILAHDPVCFVPLGASKRLLQGRVAPGARAVVRVVGADLRRGHLGRALQAGALRSGICPSGWVLWALVSGVATWGGPSRQQIRTALRCLYLGPSKATGQTAAPHIAC